MNWCVPSAPIKDEESKAQSWVRWHDPDYAAIKQECWNSNQSPFASKGRVWGVLVAQSCLTLHNAMDCSLPGSSIHGVLQARIPEWVAISSSRGSFWPRDGAQVSCIASGFFTIWVTRDVHVLLTNSYFPYPDPQCHLFHGLLGASHAWSSETSQWIVNGWKYSGKYWHHQVKDKQYRWSPLWPSSSP